MAKRRTNGEGNPRKRKDDRWEGRYIAGRTPETGRAIYKSVLDKTQTEAKVKLKQAVKEAKGLGAVKVGRYVVRQWMEAWFKHYAKIRIRPSSRRTYRGCINNHIRPNIDKVPLKKLTSLELQKFYKKLLEKGRVCRIEGRKRFKGLSAKAVRNIHRIISSAMKPAQKQELIASSPAGNCTLSRLGHRKMRTLSVGQLQSFFRGVRDSSVFELYYLELATGLHQEELLGLKWEDIDLERGDLRVRRQTARVNGEMTEALLKTKNAYRTLPLAKDTIGVLEAQRKKTGSSSWAFPDPMGVPIFLDSVLYMFHRVLKGAGFSRIRFHDLRHTFAILILQNGVDVKTVSGVLGHFSAWFTLDTYAHVTTASQRQAAKTMGDILSANPQP